MLSGASLSERTRTVCVCLCVCVYLRLSFPLHSGMWPGQSLSFSLPLSLSLSLESTFGFQIQSLWSFSLCLLPGREPSLSLSAGMKARVEMLARLHPHAIYGHTKAGDERGRRRQIKGSHGSAHWPHLRLLYKDLPPTPNLFSRKPQKHFPVFFFPFLFSDTLKEGSFNLSGFVCLNLASRFCSCLH